MAWTTLPRLNDVSLSSVLWSAVAIAGTLLAARYAGRAVTRLSHRLASVEEDKTLRASRVVRYVVLMVGASVVLAILGAPVEPLIAIVLLVVAAVALMARGVADNFGAGLVLQARHSIKFGDLVTSCGYTGRVADLNSRTVVLETLDGATIHLPNQRVMKDPLVNASTLGRVRSELQVRLPVSSADLAAPERRLVDRAETTAGVLADPAPDLLLVGADPDRLTFALRYWHSPDVTAEVCSRVAQQIRRAYEADDTEVALAWPAPPPPPDPTRCAVTPLAPLLVGGVLCFFGARSVRLSVLLAGFGVGWVLAEALGASPATALLVGASTAVSLGVLVLLMTRFLFLVAGGCVGAVVGARLFVVLEADAADGHGSWLVGLVFVAAIALLSGFLASRGRRRFLVWGTALAGGALVLGGIGRLWTTTDDMWRPHSSLGGAVFAVAWAALTVIGHRVQTRHDRRKDRDD